MGALPWICLSLLCCQHVAGRLSEECSVKEAEVTLQDCRKYFSSLKTSSLDDEDLDCCVFLGARSCFQWRLRNCDSPELFEMIMLTNRFGQYREKCSYMLENCQSIQEFIEILDLTKSSLQINDFVLLPDGDRSPKSIGRNGSSQMGSEYGSTEEHHQKHSIHEFHKNRSSEEQNSERSSSESEESHHQHNSTINVTASALNNTALHMTCSAHNSNCTKQPKTFSEFSFPVGDSGVLASNQSLFDPRVHAVETSNRDTPPMNLTAPAFPSPSNTQGQPMNMTALFAPLPNLMHGQPNTAMNFSALFPPPPNMQPMNLTAIFPPPPIMQPMNLTAIFPPLNPMQNQPNTQMNITTIFPPPSNVHGSSNEIPAGSGNFSSTLGSNDTTENITSSREARGLEADGTEFNRTLNSTEHYHSNSSNGTQPDKPSNVHVINNTSENETFPDRLARAQVFSSNVSNSTDANTNKSSHNSAENGTIPESSEKDGAHSNSSNSTTEHLQDHGETNITRSERTLHEHRNKTVWSVEGNNSMVNETSNATGILVKEGNGTSSKAHESGKVTVESEGSVNKTQNGSTDGTRSERFFTLSFNPFRNDSTWEGFSSVPANTVDNGTSTSNDSREARSHNSTEMHIENHNGSISRSENSHLSPHGNIPRWKLSHFIPHGIMPDSSKNLNGSLEESEGSLNGSRMARSSNGTNQNDSPTTFSNSSSTMNTSGEEFFLVETWSIIEPDDDFRDERSWSVPWSNSKTNSSSMTNWMKKTDGETIQNHTARWKEKPAGTNLTRADHEYHLSVGNSTSVKLNSTENNAREERFWPVMTFLTNGTRTSLTGNDTLKKPKFEEQKVGNSSVPVLESHHFANNTREGRSWDLYPNIDARQGRSQFLEGSDSHIELGKKDFLNFFDATSRFVEIMDSECSASSQEELKQSLKQLLRVICYNEKDLCTSERRPRQNEFANWLASIMGTTRSTATSPGNETKVPTAEHVNATSNATKPIHTGMESLLPAGNPFGTTLVANPPNTTMNLTDPSTLALLINKMEEGHTNAPDFAPSTTKDTDFIFSSASRPWCLTTVIVLSVFILIVDVLI